jgi:phage terminase Nu1 subunit (DNA packaging protein)
MPNTRSSGPGSIVAASGRGTAIVAGRLTRSLEGIPEEMQRRYTAMMGKES